MRTVRASVVVEGGAVEVDQLWHDPHRWASWIDGFAHVVKLEGEWPLEGARRVWSSRSRGVVAETVVAHAVGDGQTLRVEDERVAGEHTVRFESDGVRTRITVTLELEPKRRLAPGRRWWLRRGLREALRRTLLRFSYELAAER
jgi:hypothetical protein